MVMREAEIVIESDGFAELGFGFGVALEHREKKSDLIAQLGRLRCQAGGFLECVEGSGGIAVGDQRTPLRDKLLDRLPVLRSTDRDSAQKKRSKQLRGRDHFRKSRGAYGRAASD